METTASVIRHITSEASKVIVGQDEFIRQCLAAILSSGHALVEGVPGIAKTLTVKTIARIVSVDFKRVQCTSDLMPADILGTNILDETAHSFRLHRGPVFTDLLLVDEINRMPPRTQAALLEVMEERQITIDGTSYTAPPFFTVFATQNPVEFEGTYPLPEAQLDRFLVKISVPYPDFDAELAILRRHADSIDAELADAPVELVSQEDLQEARRQVATVKIEPALLEYVARLVRKTREWSAISLGASPRAAVSLMKVAKAYAALEERDFVVPDDVKSAAAITLRHRILLRPESELEGLTADDVLQQVLRSVEVPR